MHKNWKTWILTAMTFLFVTAPVFAQDAATHGWTDKWLNGIGVGIGMALAAGLAALGDSRAIAAACEGTARNPGAGARIQTMMLIGLVLIETLVLFTFAMLFLKL